MAAAAAPPRNERVQHLIPGTRPSLQNGQLRCSTGNTSIDAIFNGGIPLGATWLIEEDRCAVHSRALQRYFLGEGALHQHRMLVINLDSDPKEFITKIPCPCAEQPGNIQRHLTQHPPSSASSSPSLSGGDSDDLRIAWRYSDLPKIDAEQRLKNSTHSFDLSTQIDEDALQKLAIGTFGQQDAGEQHVDAKPSQSTTTGFQNPLYARLLNAIRAEVFAERARGNVLRICITGLGGPLWYDRRMGADLCRFLTVLQAMLRQSAAAVCCVSMPMHLLANLDDRIVARLRNIVDYALELESFSGSEREANPIFADYHGLLHIRRMRALNTLAAGVPATGHDLAFKLRRRQFVVEKLHLPPELQEAAEALSMSCSSSAGAGGGDFLKGGASQALLDF